MSRKRLLISSGIAVVVFDIVLILIDQRLEATGGPSILGLEFAGSASRAHQIMAEWGDHGCYLARLSLWIDFGFMLGYGTFFALAGFATRDFAREHGHRTLALAGVAAPYCAMAAAVFDAAENIVWLRPRRPRWGRWPTLRHDLRELEVPADRLRAVGARRLILEQASPRPVARTGLDGTRRASTSFEVDPITDPPSASKTANGKRRSACRSARAPRIQAWA